MDTEMELYLHIPFCVKKCEYCDFLSGPYDEKTQHAYVLALCNEIRYMGRQIPAKLRSVFIGGGTPSWLDGQEMERIMETVKASFTLLPGAEVTIECNPGTVTREKLSIYRSSGINRLSIGLQSANEEELKLLGRIHTFDRFLHTYEMAREAGFSNISVDIMTGLPGQTKELLSHTLSSVLRLKPEHISAYSLIIEEGTPFYEKYTADEDAEYELMKWAREYLEQRGYHRYEISNYARPGYESLHNTGYWRRVPYIGCGVGAAGLLVGGREGNGELRTENIRDIYRYIELCSQLPDIKIPQGDLYSPLWEEQTPLTREDAMEEFMFLGLRMTEGISAAEFASVFGIGIEEVYGEVLQRFYDQGLMERQKDRIFLTEQGMDVSNMVLAEFLLS